MNPVSITPIFVGSKDILVRLFTFSLFLGFPLSLNGQVLPIVDSTFTAPIYRDLIQIAIQQKVNGQGSSLKETSTEWRKLLKLNFVPQNSLKKEWFQQQNEVYQKLAGLKWTSSASLREQGEVEELNQNMVQDGVFLRTGVEWNFFKEGMLEKNRKRKLLEKDYLLFKLEEELNHRQRNYIYLYSLIIQLFNKQKIKLLEERIAVLKEVVVAIYKMYYNHHLPYSTLNLYKGKLDEALILLDGFKTFNQGGNTVIEEGLVAQFDVERLPIFKVDLEKLLEDGHFSHLVRKRNHILKDKIDLNFEQHRQKKLRVYGHYNIRSMAYSGQQNFMTLGTSFSMPIDFGKKEKHELQELEKRMVDWENMELMDNVATELMNLYYEYEYKLRTYNRFLYKIEALKEKERVETVLLELSKGFHSPMRLIEIQEEKVAVEIEVMDLKRDLFLKLLRIYTKSNHPHFMDCLEVMNLDHIGKKLLGERYFLLEADKIPLSEATFLKAYLEKNELNNILIEGTDGRISEWKKMLEGPEFAFFSRKLKRNTTKEYEENVFVSDKENKKIVWAQKGALDNPKWYKLVYVPVANFKSRLELESWIAQKLEHTQHTKFLFTDFFALKELDEQILHQLTTN